MPIVYAIVIGIVDNPHDAEEVVQDTFLNAYRGLAQYEERDQIQKLVGNNCAKSCAQLVARTENRYRVHQRSGGAHASDSEYTR